MNPPIAVMSRSEDKVRSYAERHNIPKWYTDAQQLIDDPDVNAVYIATPPSTHVTYAIMTLKSGKPAYIEKPLASNYQDCGRINRIAEKTGVPCFAAYYRRYLPYFIKVKQIITSGEIGKVINVQLRSAAPPRDLDYSRQNLPWRVQPDIAGGGYFYDFAPHQIDMLQEIFGPIVEAKGYCDNRDGLYETEDTVSAAFRFASGLPGSGSWCFVAHESAKENTKNIKDVHFDGLKTYTHSLNLLILHRISWLCVADEADPAALLLRSVRVLCFLSSFATPRQGNPTGLRPHIFAHIPNSSILCLCNIP